MSLGSVLLRPQSLTKGPPPQKARALSILLECLPSLAQEIATGGQGWAIIQEEMIASLEQLAGEVEPRMEAASAHLSGMIEPLAGILTEALSTGPADGGIESIAASGQAFMQILVRGFSGLTAASLSQTLGALFDVLESDLGLTEARFRQFYRETADRVVTRLQAEYLGGAAAAGAYGRYALGESIRELGDLVAQHLDLPPLNRQTLLPVLAQMLQDLRVEETVGPIAERMTAVSDALEPLAKLASTFSGGGATPEHRAVAGLSLAREAASEQKTCWYASWLAEHTVTGANPTSIAEGGPLAGWDFGKISAEVMEKTAFHSRWAALALESTLPHALAIGLEPRAVMPHVLVMLWRGLEAFLAGLNDFEFPLWAKYVWWGAYTYPMGYLGVLEDPHARRHDDWYGPLMILYNFAETQLYTRWIWLARELLLSCLTLHNQQRSGCNCDQIEGVSLALSEIFTVVYARIVATDQAHYGFPNAGHADMWGNYVVPYALGGTLGAMAFTWAIGPLVGWAISGQPPSSERWARMVLKERLFPPRVTFGTSDGSITVGILHVIAKTIIALVSYLLDSLIYLYVFADGQTDGGTFSNRRSRATGQVVFTRTPGTAGAIDIPVGTIVCAPASGSRPALDFETTQACTLAATDNTAQALVRFRPTEHQESNYAYGDLPASAITNADPPLPGIQGATNPSALAAGPEISYAGYPDRTNSPYRLPYERGKIYQCVQGNQGLYSHTPHSWTSEIYAYDFSHDAGDEVLAIRDGIVWSFEDTNPDGNDDYHNGIIILHDPVPAPPPAGHALHDFNESGQPVRTLAHYFHGQQDSVTAALQDPGAGKTHGTTTAAALVSDPANAVARQAFVDAGINPATLAPGTVLQAILDADGKPVGPLLTAENRSAAVLAGFPAVLAGYAAEGINLAKIAGNITNSVAVWVNENGDPVRPIRIRRGQLIMRADDTGRSAYNHLHLHITPARVDAAGDLLGISGYSIPFVFGDADAERHGGRLRSGHWYKSDNEKVT